MWQQQGRVYFGCSLCTAALRHRAVLSACSSCWDWMKGRSRWKVRFSCARWPRWLLSFRREGPLLTTCASGETTGRSTGPIPSRIQTALATRARCVSGKRGLKASSMLQSWQSWIPLPSAAPAWAQALAVISDRAIVISDRATVISVQSTFISDQATVISDRATV